MDGRGPGGGKRIKGVVSERPAAHLRSRRPDSVSSGDLVRRRQLVSDLPRPTAPATRTWLAGPGWCFLLEFGSYRAWRQHPERPGNG